MQEINEELEYRIGNVVLTEAEARHYFKQLTTYRKEIPQCATIGKETGKLYDVQPLDVIFET